jgi:hypothetical protein
MMVDNRLNCFDAATMCFLEVYEEESYTDSIGDLDTDWPCPFLIERPWRSVSVSSNTSLRILYFATGSSRAKPSYVTRTRTVAMRRGSGDDVGHRRLCGRQGHIKLTNELQYTVKILRINRLIINTN